MYLKEIFLQNTGPISECHVKPSFDNNGNPLPIVIVGPNGSGKTIFLSYIVDALIEFAKQAFRDIVLPDSVGEMPYFRAIQSMAIKSGQSFSLSLLHFKANNDNLYYCEKSGVLKAASYSPSVKSAFTPVWNWPMEDNYKSVSAHKETVETEMKNGAHAFFPATRREDPDWLNPQSLKTSMSDHVHQRLDGRLDKPLWVGTCAKENISWILDVFLDSLVNFDFIGLAPLMGLDSFISHEEQQELSAVVDTLQRQNLGQQEILSSQELLPIMNDIMGGQNLVQALGTAVNNLQRPNLGQEFLLLMNNIMNRQVFVQARNNVEQILKTILRDEAAELILNFRNIGSSRISIKMGDGRIIPTLQSLSEGQSQLFHLFATIIKYGEWSDLKRSVDLSQITGLVVIDEIATHLHPTLQHDVLPELIGLFPKVQFIVSSHSPLFLLGMEKTFGADRVNILELPEAKKINSERYSEFGKAFKYIKSTERFEDEIKQRFAAGTKPLVLTEGPLDVRYIQQALRLLGKSELLNSIDIEFVGMENGQGTRYGGDQGLNHFRNIYAANPSLFRRPILLLYDCDTQKRNEEIEELWVRSIPKNAKNTKVTKGIENLFPEALFREEFYRETSTDDGGYAKRLDKPSFCDWICEEGSDTDFAKFNSVVEILKEFSAS